MERDSFSFSAPWGNLLKIISALVTIILLGIFGGMAISGRASTPFQVLLYLIVPMLIIFTGLLFTVKGYVLSGTTLKIRRLIWDTEIELGVIKNVEHDRRAMSGAIRTWGNGGLYSFSGRFRSTRLGSFKAYVTDYGNCVIIETISATIVISPGEPERFVETLRNHLWTG